MFPPQQPEGVCEHLNLETSLFCSESYLIPGSQKPRPSLCLQGPAPLPFPLQPSPPPRSPSHPPAPHTPRASCGPSHRLLQQPLGSSSLLPLTQGISTYLSSRAARPPSETTAPTSSPLLCFVSLLPGLPSAVPSDSLPLYAVSVFPHWAVSPTGTGDCITAVSAAAGTH